MSSFPRQPAAEQRPASFQEFIGLERWTDADGMARVRLGHRPELMNYLQQFHGGVLMSVLDAAMAQAIRACLPDCSMVTIDMATHFMGSARGELRAVGRMALTWRACVSAMRRHGGCPARWRNRFWTRQRWPARPIWSD